MKKTLLLIALLLAATMTFAQEKNIKLVEYNKFVGLDKQLGEDRYKIDSLILKTEHDLGPEEFATLLDCCVNGRLTGIDMSMCWKLYKAPRRIPARAFMPTIVNGKPRKTESEDEKNVFRTNLRYITLPKTLETIEAEAFALTNIETIEIPYNTTVIGNMAFEGCENLKEVVLCGNKPHEERTGMEFAGLPSDAVLHVAPGLGDYYWDSESWKAFGNVREDDRAFRMMDLHLDGSSTLEEMLGDDMMRIDSLHLSGTPGKNDFAVLRNMGKEGRLFGLDLTDCEASEDVKLYCSILETLRMPKNQVKIPGGCFQLARIKTLVLPENYEEIGVAAFEMFVYAPDSAFVVAEGCRRLDSRAFSLCKSLKNLYIPSTLEALGPGSIAFNGAYEEVNDVDIYVNRMLPPVSEDISEDTGTEQEESYGPFGCIWEHGSPACYTYGWRLFVPVGAKKNYENAKYWDHFATIIETPLLTGTPSSISEAAGERKTAAADGIYTIDGRFIAKGVPADGLAKGLYVVRENGLARKVVMGR